MATVYLARDRKHERLVALKILRPELAAILGGERFLNEIKVTANLQHPNILPLYDSGQADTFLYYVMPYVEGESLRDRMEREKQLPVEDTVALARDVADALHFAHEQGIVHRDIKPENILLQRGKPLVADFGIALAVSQAGGARLTETGLSLGTPHYMSPEQATGDRELDARSDVYSLGAMVYEMLTGEPPHEGRTVQAIVARIIADEPEPVTKHRPSVPPHVAAAVRKALDKTPADRFSSAAKFAEALGNPAFTTARTVATPAAAAGPPARWSAVTGGLAIGCVVLAAAAAWGWLRGPGPGAPPVIRYRVLDGTINQTQDYGTNVAVSPDGSVMVRAGHGADGGGFGLWVQRRDQLEPTPLPGGEEAHQPFFSPDGTRVGFITLSRALRVASLGGEPTVTLVDSGIVRGSGSWGTDGYIYLAGGSVDVNASATGLVRMPAAGGPLETVTTFDTAGGEVNHSFPEALPGGRGVLFTVSHDRMYMAQDQEIAVADLATGAHRALLRGILARWSPTGHILVVQADGKLVAAPFDEERLELTGPATPLLDGVRVDGFGTADLAVSRSGRLVYGAGDPESAAAIQVVWAGRDGAVAVIDTAWTGLFLSPSVSPDGSMMAVQVGITPNAEVWVKRLPRGPFSRLTFDGRFNGGPSWTPDGRSVLFLSDMDRPNGVTRPFVKPADGSSEAVLVLDAHVVEAAYSADGHWLVYTTSPRAERPGIYARRLAGDTAARLLVPRRAGEGQARLSPDGRWLAYTGTETGQREVYVRPFPDAESARWQVSVGGGVTPRWAPDGRQLYYLGGGRGEVVAVPVERAQAFQASDPRPLFRLGTLSPPNGWDVAPDGRFAMIQAREAAAGAARELVVVEHFFQELRAQVAAR